MERYCRPCKEVLGRDVTFTSWWEIAKHAIKCPGFRAAKERLQNDPIYQRMRERKKGQP